jgi:tetratricopeptide (TPR) repeat protein
METGVWHLPDGAAALVVVWALSLFVIWFVYRHNPYFSRAKMFTATSVSTALLFFALLYIWPRNRLPSDPVRVAIFPLLDETSGRGEISPLSLLTAEVAAEALSGNEDKLLPYRLNWILQAVTPDSLTHREYIRRVSRELRVDYVFWGRLRSDGGTPTELKFSWEAFRPGDEREGQRWQSTVSLTRLSGLTNDLSRLLPGELTNGSVRAAYFDNVGELRVRRYAEARFARWQGESKRVLPVVQEAAGADTSFVPALLLWAEALIDSGGARRQRGLEEEAYPHFRLAKRLLLKALETDSTNAVAYRLLGSLYIWNERWQKAEEYLKLSQRYDWWQPQLYLEVSRLHPSRYQEFGAAKEEQLYERAIAIFPGCLEAYIDLAEYYEFRHQWKRAVEVLEAFLRINPNSVDALMALGRHYVNRYELVDVLKLYQRILELDPGNAGAYYNLGVAYYNHEDLETAERFFKKAIRVNDHLDSHLYLAMIYSKRGEEDKAVEELRYRLKHRRGRNDPYAEEARKMLFRIMSSREISANESQP